MMQLTVISARDPVYSDDTGNAIAMYVKFAEFNEELPFTAANFDVMDYGRELYANAVAGAYGPIGEYVPPPDADTPFVVGNIPGSIL